MEAAKLVKVPDSISKGADFLPSAGSSGKIPGGTVGAGPAPTPAINSGKTLDSSLLSPSARVNNGQGRLYKGSPDNDSDDVALNPRGNGSEGTKASNE